MARVTDCLSVDTARDTDGAHRFALVAEGAGVTAYSTSTYDSQADAVSASSRMADADAVEAVVVERAGGHAVRLAGGTLEAVTDAWASREQAESTLELLTR